MLAKILWIRHALVQDLVLQFRRYLVTSRRCLQKDETAFNARNRCNDQNLIHIHEINRWPPKLVENIRNLGDVALSPDFITEDEERQFEVDTHQQLRRLRYEDAHWDDAIRKYREIEKSEWSPICQTAIQRVREAAFPTDGRLLNSVHVLDLAADGYIKPHIDSDRYCGDVIAGLSLLTDSVMRLIHKDRKELVFDLYLKRRSLYVLKGVARYEFTHEILADAQSYFNGLQVPRKVRRLAVICRLLPHSTEGVYDDNNAT